MVFVSGCPETSVQNYHSTLRHIPEERQSHLRRSKKPEITLQQMFQYWQIWAVH
jgi:hypothetical protein